VLRVLERGHEVQRVDLAQDRGEELAIGIRQVPRLHR
jgi:hypothetical protein